MRTHVCSQAVGLRKRLAARVAYIRGLPGIGGVALQMLDVAKCLFRGRRAAG